MSALTEQFLLFRIRSRRDPQAFAQIYQVYAKPISRFISLKVGGREQVEDLTTDTFIKAWQYLQQVQSVDNLKALLYKVARSVVVDHYRKTGAKEVVSLDAEEGELLEPMDERAADLPDHVDIQLIVARLPELRNDYRDVLVLKYVEHLDTEQIADVMGISKGHVRVLTHRALLALKSLIHAQAPLTTAHADQR
jgi:RNA polymerase sigma-70 factor (ECF subfamily)